MTAEDLKVNCVTNIIRPLTPVQHPLTSLNITPPIDKMVRVSVAYIIKKGSPNAPKHCKDSSEHLKKLTHLYLNDQYVESIGDISICKNLKVLFLQNNELQNIENLSFASQLTHLYLQRNKLQKMHGFEGLTSLRKLYLGHNCISVVEGLETLECLQELHVEHQKLCPGEEIIFDPRTISTLGGTLETLNIQGNGLTSLDDIVGLDNLKILLVASNNLSDVTKLRAVITALPSLLELDMRDNPVTQNYKNCDRILASTSKLQVFNKKQISLTTLDFMKKFDEHHQKTATNIPLSVQSEIIDTISELPFNLPDALAKDVTRSMLKDSGVRKAPVTNNLTDGFQTSESTSSSHDLEPYFHFPAFKSSTSMQYEGHTIPKPFKRQIIMGAHPNQRQCSFDKSKSDWPINVPLKCVKSLEQGSGSEGDGQFVLTQKMTGQPVNLS